MASVAQSRAGRTRRGTTGTLQLRAMTSKVARQHVEQLISQFRSATVGKADTTGMLARVISATERPGPIRTVCTALRAEGRAPVAGSSADCCSGAVRNLEMLLVGLHAQAVCSGKRSSRSFQELKRAVRALNEFSVENGVVPRYVKGHDLKGAISRALRAICEA